MEEKALDSFTMYTRNGGCAVVHNSLMFVWGGQSSRKVDDEDSDAEDEDIIIPIDLPLEEDDNNVIDVFDIDAKLWWHYPTTGDVPRLGLGSSLCIEGDHIYLYGGWNNYRFSSELYRLSLSTFEWSSIVPKTDVKPTPVYLTTALAYCNRICTFGGVGLRVSKEKQKENGADYDEYAPDPNPWGWNNEYHEYDISAECWISPKVINRPSPVSAMNLTQVDPHRAILYGGRIKNGRSNKLFLFNLQTKVWFEPREPPPRDGPDHSWPSIKSFHSCSCLHDPEVVGRRIGGKTVHQKVLLLWGKYHDSWICPQSWVLEIKGDDIKWTKINLNLKARTWHTACAKFSDSSEVFTKILVFGGNVHVTEGKRDRVETADLKILSFGNPVPRLQTILLNMTSEMPAHLLNRLPQFLRSKVTEHKRIKSIYPAIPIDSLI